LETAFGYAGLDPYKYLQIDERLKRPHEVPLLLGDSSKARKVLGWEPKVNFTQLVKMCYQSDFALAIQEVSKKKNES